MKPISHQLLSCLFAIRISRKAKNNDVTSLLHCHSGDLPGRHESRCQVADKTELLLVIPPSLPSFNKSKSLLIQCVSFISVLIIAAVTGIPGRCRLSEWQIHRVRWNDKRKAVYKKRSVNNIEYFSVDGVKKINDLLKLYFTPLKTPILTASVV
jgi:hypothetical protein